MSSYTKYKVIKKRILRILLYPLVIISALLLTLFVLLRDPMVQTFMARVSAQYLSEKLHVDVRINELTISNSLNILVKGIEIYDIHKKPLLLADNIELIIGKLNLKNQRISLNKIIIDQGKVGLRTYKNEEVLNLQFILDHFSTNAEPKNNVHTKDNEWRIKCRSLRLINTNFQLVNENKEPISTGIDYDRIMLENINLDMENIAIGGDTIHAHINYFNCKEQSGFVLENFSGQFYLSATLLRAESVKIKTLASELDLDFTFTYENFTAFNDFVNEVFINADIKKSRLNMADIGYFAPELLVMKNQTGLQGKVQGKVNDLHTKNFIFDFGAATYFRGDIDIKGLPYIKKTTANIQFHEFRTSVNDIRQFSLPGEDSTYIELPKQINALGNCALIGHFYGSYNNFDTKIVLQSEAGNLLSELKVSTNNTSKHTKYTGHLQALRLDAGAITNNTNYFGTTNFDLAFQGSGLTMETALMQINGELSALNIKQHNYDKLLINGQLANKKFKGRLLINDESIDFSFDGYADFGKTLPEFDFSSTIKNARLHALNLFKYDSTAVLSTRIQTKFSGIKPEEITGMIKVDSTLYFQQGKEFRLKKLTLNSQIDSAGNKNIVLESDFIDTQVQGNFLLRDISISVNEMLKQYMPALFAKDTDTSYTNSIKKNSLINFAILFKNTNTLSELLAPAISIAPNSGIQGSYKLENKLLTLDVNIPLMDIAGTKLSDVFVKSNNDNSRFYLQSGAGEVIFREASKKDSVRLGIENFSILISALQDNINMQLNWDGIGENKKNTGTLEASVEFFNKNNAELKIHNAGFLVNDTNWSIAANNLIKIDSSNVHIKNLTLFSKSQQFTVHGHISENPKDSVTLTFDNWDFSNFDVLINQPNLNTDGIINGHISLLNLYKAPNLKADIGITKLYLNKQKLGRATLQTNWDNASEALFANFQLINIGNVGESKVMDISGLYYPNKKSENLNFNILLKNLRLPLLAPFATGIASNIKGYTSGKIHLKGSTKKPILEGELKLMRAEARVDYLNTQYSLANEIKFSENQISFDEIILYDTLGNKALCEGKIKHAYFNDFELDISIHPENFSALNTNQDQNKEFYGNARVSGIVEIYGPVDKLTIDILVTTEEGTDISIPINNSTDIYETDYIVFVNPVDTGLASPKYNANSTGLTINLGLQITEDADIALFLPYDMGNIKADGSGDLNLSIDPSGDFQIQGDYNIKKGTFYFTLQNLVNRRFNIIEGSSISWTGNPYDAEIDLRALYKTKASLNDLPGMEEDNRRVNVDCYISLSKQLFNPEIHFNIGLPNLDKDTEQRVFFLIDTTNEAQMNQQMISLLVLGSFNISSSSTSNIGASSFNVISNQLSNWLSQISKDFDIGINYRPGQDISEEELEVALSTQLFNERVSVESNVGVVGNQQSNNTSNIVGDVNVEVKITEDGRFRVKAFNRSNVNTIENNTNYDDISPNTQGIGVFYRKEFDSFKELFRWLKKKQKKNDTIQQIMPANNNSQQ